MEENNGVNNGELDVEYFQSWEDVDKMRLKLYKKFEKHKIENMKNEWKNW